MAGEIRTNSAGQMIEQADGSILTTDTGADCADCCGDVCVIVCPVADVFQCPRCSNPDTVGATVTPERLVVTTSGFDEAAWQGPVENPAGSGNFVEWRVAGVNHAGRTLYNLAKYFGGGGGFDGCIWVWPFTAGMITGVEVRAAGGATEAGWTVSNEQAFLSLAPGGDWVLSMVADFNPPGGSTHVFMPGMVFVAAISAGAGAVPCCEFDAVELSEDPSVPQMAVGAGGVHTLAMAAEPCESTPPE